MSERRRDLLVVSGIAFFVLVILSVFTWFVFPERDLWYFKIPWGHEILDLGPSRFYGRTKYDTDYPPLWLLILGAMALLSRVINASETLEHFIFRLPNLLVFVASIFVFFALLKHFGVNGLKAYTITIVYAFSPAAWLNVFWGQADMFLVFGVMVMTLLVLKQRFFLALLVGTFVLLIKFHLVFVLPFLGFVIIHKMYNKKQIFKLMSYLGICLIIVLAFYAPFVWRQVINGNPFFLFEIISKPFTHYQFFAVRAFNFYTAIGLDKVTYPGWFFAVNMLILLSVFLLFIWLYVKSPTESNILVLTMLSAGFVYMFSTNMMARYFLMSVGVMQVAAHILKNPMALFANYFFYMFQFMIGIIVWFAIDWDFPQIMVPISIVSVIVFLIISFVSLRCVIQQKPEVS